MLLLLGGLKWLTTEDPTGRPVGMVTGAEGGNMVFVKVRETYDLHTTKNKMTVIGIHTPKPDIIKQNYPGLLMQCKAYRPVSADVRIACASMLPLDPQGVGTDVGDVAPEDVFNPILYKAMSNFGMSQLEARINGMAFGSFQDVSGNTADVDVDTVTSQTDEFGIYYGLLSNTHDWKHASPQAGLEMKNLRPLVWEALYSVGDTKEATTGNPYFTSPSNTDTTTDYTPRAIRGNAKPMPFINCTSYSAQVQTDPHTGVYRAGFNGTGIFNSATDIPYLNVFVGAIIVPPSRLHELFYRMVVEWTIEFSGIRPLSEVMNWLDLNAVGLLSHYQNYSYESNKEAITGSKETILDSDSCMVSANVDVNKVM